MTVETKDRGDPSSLLRELLSNGDYVSKEGAGLPGPVLRDNGGLQQEGLGQGHIGWDREELFSLS